MTYDILYMILRYTLRDMCYMIYDILVFMCTHARMKRCHKRREKGITKGSEKFTIHFPHFANILYE